MPSNRWTFKIALDKDGTGERTFHRENMPADLGSDWSPLLGKGSEEVVSIEMPADHAREVYALAKAAAIVKLVNPARLAYRKHGWQAAEKSLRRIFGERIAVTPTLVLEGDFLAAQVDIIRQSNPRHEVVVKGRVFETIEEMLAARTELEVADAVENMVEEHFESEDDEQ